MKLAIDWHIDSQIIDGWSTPNLYGLLFVGGMILGYYVIRKMFRSEAIPEKYLDRLLFYVVPATIIGARLGHVFFYGPYHDGFNAKGVWERGYLDHPMDIFKVWEGGLASHGAAIVILIMLYVYSQKVVKRPMLWILDRIVAPIAIAGCFIRLGNLVNHEIIGIPTDLPWGFRFFNADPEYLVNGEVVPRHPSQLYEAICYFISFIILYRMYWKTKAKLSPGKLFGAFMILIWSARFFIEFIKVGQNDNDDIWMLKTGQWLSIPFVLIGLYLTFRKVPAKEQEKFDEAVAKPLP
ncbi:prolipoprotein diacylglyceryl transferase [Fluviicola sp.]|uniref:prolipoprotein diacylglyceryl transferase n=1 Tax=Fluviicola sp. TaxID=1917219 RepID=UPI0031D63C2D